MKKKMIDYIREIIERTEKETKKQFEERTKWRPVKVLARRLNINNDEALIFAYGYFATLTAGEFNANEIREKVSNDPFDLVRVLEVLKQLNDKNIIKGFGNSVNSDFKITADIILKIGSNKSIKTQTKNKNKDIFQLTDELITIFYLRFELLNTPDEFYEEIDEFYEKNKNYAPFKFLIKNNVSQDEWLIFLHAFLSHMNGEGFSSVKKGAKHLYRSATHQFSIKSKLIKGDAKIIKNGLVEFIGNEYKSADRIRVSKKSMKAILKEHYDVVMANMEDIRENDEILVPEKITGRQLFYNKNEKKQLKVIKDIIAPNRLDKVQKNLENAGHKIGVCVLFYGEPGTGKTESVLQLAKENNRPIMKVDIASIKDKYIGESEKNLKNIFQQYNEICKNSDIIPILLFNEADALLNKRIRVKQSSDQMNNAMQNILLEELENFRGVMFATTNLIPNLDTAFERRFLYKVKFNKPSKNVRKMIWSAQLTDFKDLSSGKTKKDFNELVEHFDLSGGQIENVVRKVRLDTILYDKPLDLKKLQQLCKEERLKQNKQTKRKIGFVINNGKNISS